MVKTARCRSCVHIVDVLFLGAMAFVPMASAQSLPDGGAILHQIDAVPQSSNTSTPTIQLPARTACAPMRRVI